MGKSFKNLMLSIFIILLILFPILKHATNKPGKANIQTLRAPYENFDNLEKDDLNSTENLRRRQTASKNDNVNIIQKRRKHTIRRSLSADEKSDQPEKHPFISDEQFSNTNSISTTTDLDKGETSSRHSEFFIERSLEEQSPNVLKSSRSAFKNHKTGQSDMKQQEKLKPPEINNHLNDNSLRHKKSNLIDQNLNKNLKSTPSINDNIDLNNELIKKPKRLDSHKKSKRLDSHKKLKKLDNHNDYDDGASSVPLNFRNIIIKRSIPFNIRDKSELKSPVKKIRPIDELLSRNPTDAEKVAWAVHRQKKMVKYRKTNGFEPTLNTINESDEKNYKDNETKEQKAFRNETKEGRFTNKDKSKEYKMKIEKYFGKLFNHLKRFIEKENYNEMYTKLYEDKFKNGIKDNRDNIKHEKKLETTYNELNKYDTIDSEQNNINKINDFSESTLKDHVLENMGNMTTQRSTDLRFILFVDKCHDFHSKYMAEAYKELASKYSRNSCNDFLDCAWKIYLKHMEGDKHIYTPEEVGPFLSMLHVMSHYINEPDQEYFKLSYRDYLSKYILENTDDQELIEAVRSTPYYGIVHMLDSLAQIKAINENTAPHKDHDINGTYSNSSAGITTDVSDFDLDLFG